MGDPVFAQIGKWTPGHILVQWDEGNPYRILLGDGQGTMVWGPMDNDNFVRRNPNGKKMDKKQIAKILSMVMERDRPGIPAELTQACVAVVVVFISVILYIFRDRLF